MKIFDVDVSGNDILSKDYTISIANKDGIIKGFKFDERLVQILNSRYGQGIYRYKKSKNGKSLFKVRIYSIIIYYLFKSLKVEGAVFLNVCRDFEGREGDIEINFNHFLVKLLGMNLENRINFTRLDKNSNAHQYSYLMRKDVKNKMTTYVKISLEDIEKYLKK